MSVKINADLSEEHVCDFCQKSMHEVPTMVAGPNVDICSGCIIEAYIVVGHQQGENRDPNLQRSFEEIWKQ